MGGKGDIGRGVDVGRDGFTSVQPVITSIDANSI